LRKRPKYSIDSEGLMKKECHDDREEVQSPMGKRVHLAIIALD